MTAECTLRVSSPAELIAAVPYLLGFHPTDSLAVMAMRGKKIIFAARHDLPESSLPRKVARADAAEIAAVVAGQGVTTATIIGYGEPAQVTPTVLRVADALTRSGVPVLDQLRVTGGRFWSYLCQDLDCCPAEGRACLPANSAIAAAATYGGAVALPDRAALVNQIAPVTDPGQAAATARAESRLAKLHRAQPHETGFLRQVRRAGRAAVRDAERRYRSGRRLDEDEVAWLGALLRHLPVRDYAWERTGDTDWWVGLWTDVLRRVEPVCVPAPAGLLAFAAWRAGHGALARVAVDRALAADPAYELAVLLSDLFMLGVHPRAVANWPSPAPAPIEPDTESAPDPLPARPSGLFPSGSASGPLLAGPAPDGHSAGPAPDSLLARPSGLFPSGLASGPLSAGPAPDALPVASASDQFPASPDVGGDPVGAGPLNGGSTADGGARKVLRPGSVKRPAAGRAVVDERLGRGSRSSGRRRPRRRAV